MYIGSVSLQTENMEEESDEVYSDVEIARMVLANKPLRIRQYHEGHKGPYKVFIRKIIQDIKYFQLNKEVRKYYKSIVDVFLSSKNKMSVTFSSMEEANAMPYNIKWNAVYKVYIPEATVEVMACVTLSIEEDENELMKYGEGKFLNPHLKKLKILEVLRFHREENISGNLVKVKVPTSVVRVTFPGQIIPERLEIDGLILRTREFRRRVMFCDNCLKYNHTSKLCNNKKICKKCLKSHDGICCENEINEVKCIHCKQEHERTVY